jgi:hypothetical protein
MPPTAPKIHRLILLLVPAFSLVTFTTYFSGGQEFTAAPPSLLHLFEGVGRTDTSEFGREVTGVGDQNGDGFADILVSALGERKSYLYLGGRPPSSLPALVFSDIRWTSCADVNGDGAKDLLFGAFNGDYNTFHAKLYYGGTELDTVADVELFSPDSGLGFGRPFGIGDFNGDGFEDFAIPNVAYPVDPSHPLGTSQGKVSVYFGAVTIDTIPSWTVYGDSVQHHFASAGVTSGDLNGDGFSDLIIGEQTFYQPFRMFIKIFLGAPKPDTLPSLIVCGSNVPTVVGDVNADGYSDWVLIKDNRKDTMALLYYGGAVLDTIPDLALKRSPFSGTGPAWSVSRVGDINGDGFEDIIVGNRRGFGGFGEVLIYLGGAPMRGDFVFGFTGYTNSYDGAGEAVGWAGDVNKDSVEDILFGAWNDLPGSNNFPGRAELFGGDKTITGISSPTPSPLPEGFRLEQNYPNPFNGETTISFTIPPAGKLGLLVPVDLAVYDLQGRVVKRLLKHQAYASGTHSVRWSTTSEQGKTVSSGVYLARLTINGHSLTEKMILIR